MRENGAGACDRAPGAPSELEQPGVTSQYPALAGLRIGCVQYLNARPLIYGYAGPVRFDHPSGLAEDLAHGELDAALVPVFEALGARHYLMVDGAAIASDGPVHSVFLAYRGELSGIRRVTLDPASLTSKHLLQVMLAEFHGLRPEYIGEGQEDGDARLLIGNQAIEFRNASPSGYRYLDLGEEWRRHTGLPFVYALWLLQPKIGNAGLIAADFRALKREGTAHIAEIVRTNGEATAAFRRRYLTQHIRFELGAREKAGMERFRELLVLHHFIPPGGKPLEYV